MPKKHQQRALLTKPQSSTPHTLSLSRTSNAAGSQNDSSQRSVNDLIRESRRLQIRSEARSPPSTNNAASIPPSLRAVLDLPQPPPPVPRAGGPRSSHGPSRSRRIPGPPPPRSWLIDSIHAPAAVRSASIAGDSDDDGRRIQIRTSNLPDGGFPPPTSLQHLVLKKMASNWEWHAKNDLDYISVLPINLRETLLSYIAVYSEAPLNPLRILFLYETDPEERAEVRRLDLSNGLGTWTTFKQLERDLVVKQPSSLATPNGSNPLVEDRFSAAPDSWDADGDNDEFASPAISATLKSVRTFSNLKHLSLAIPPANVKAASWASLLSLAQDLSTLTSLSLAYWPQPTFTPNAASTRAVVNSPGSRPVVYGGSDIYTGFDNDWREAAGILRTLSRSLYCLKWLDLTGCGDWFAALQWTPSSPSSPGSSSPERLGPEWNGGWRGIEKLVLEVGWNPAPPNLEDGSLEPDALSWNVDNERKVYRYNKDRERFAETRATAQSVARYLRSLRKESGGKWIDIELGPDLSI